MTAHILQPLDEADVKYCDNRDRGQYSGLLECFNAWVADGHHRMHILHEDGLYRHLRFRKPDRGEYWFDLVTWPGHLTITGDMGTYTFARVTDMFEFFTGYINTGYWAEKLQNGVSGGRHEVKNHDEQVFREWVIQDYFWETSRHMDPTEARLWWEELRDDVLGLYAGTNDDTNACIEMLRGMENPSPRHYQDCYEADWTRYDWHFELCLAAIVTGIRTYKEAVQ